MRYIGKSLYRESRVKSGGLKQGNSYRGSKDPGLERDSRVGVFSVADCRLGAMTICRLVAVAVCGLETAVCALEVSPINLFTQSFIAESG